jgi:hypothetical protein
VTAHGVHEADLRVDQLARVGRRAWEAAHLDAVAAGRCFARRDGDRHVPVATVRAIVRPPLAVAHRAVAEPRASARRSRQRIRRREQARHRAVPVGREEPVAVGLLQVRRALARRGEQRQRLAREAPRRV